MRDNIPHFHRGHYSTHQVPSPGQVLLESCQRWGSRATVREGKQGMSRLGWGTGLCVTQRTNEPDAGMLRRKGRTRDLRDDKGSRAEKAKRSYPYHTED